MNVIFQYGTLATREIFVDSVEERAQLRNYLSSHTNFMLVAPRQWEKSSFVNVAIKELQDEEKDFRKSIKCGLNDD